MAGVILDAGHGGYDNGAQFNGRREKDDTLRLTLAVGQALRDRGVPVQYTRQTDVYQSPIEKARNVNRRLSEVGFTDLGVKERPGLAVLRRTNIPAILIEAGFINTVKDNELFDSRFNDIANAIADGIVDTIGSGQQELGSTYRVQIGLYRNFSNAQYALNEALAQGFDGDIVYEEPYYAVQLGDFRTLDEAVQLENELKQRGYDTLVVKK